MPVTCHLPKVLSTPQGCLLKAHRLETGNPVAPWLQEVTSDTGQRVQVMALPACRLIYIGREVVLDSINAQDVIKKEGSGEEARCAPACNQ